MQAISNAHYASGRNSPAMKLNFLSKSRYAMPRLSPFNRTACILLFITRRIQTNIPTGTPIEIVMIPKAATTARMCHRDVLQVSP